MNVKDKGVFLLFFFFVWYIEDGRGNIEVIQVTSMSELFYLAKDKTINKILEEIIISTLSKSVSSYDGIDVFNNELT